MTIDEMTDELRQLSKELDTNFIELARLLRDLRDTLAVEGSVGGLPTFFDCIKAAKISRRRSYYLIEIDRVYGPLKLPRQRLAAIGWTKLSLMAGYVDAAEIEAWLKLAENSTAQGLRTFLAGKDLSNKTITLKLTDTQYSVIAGTLLANGAYLTAGAGLGNKEAALMNICHTLHKAWKAGIT